jgi:hypothetical protein
MPGLPMIGHGQVEGFAEKYGMEYRRAYRDEQPDGWLVERHEREIFPLFHRRYLFAEVTDFLLYDVFDPGGWVNEDIFAYSNRHGDERGLIIYHNRYAEAKGWIKTSTGYSVPDGSGGRKQIQRSLGEGLGLHPEGDWFVLMREQRSGLEFVRPSADLCRDGLFVELPAYGCQVFLDIHEVQDGPSGQMRRLSERLNGAGVASIGTALREMQLAPLHEAVRGLATNGSLRRLTEVGAGWAAAASRTTTRRVDLGLRGPASRAAEVVRATPLPALAEPTADELAALLDDAQAHLVRALHALVEVTGADGDLESAAVEFRAGVEAALRLPSLGRERLSAGLIEEWAWVAIFGRLISEAIMSVAGPDSARGGSFEELQLGPVIAGVFRDLGLDDGAAWRLVALIRMLRQMPLPGAVAALPAAERAPALVRALVADEAVRPYIRVNVWEGVSWFNRESFGQVLWWMAALDALAAAAEPKLSKARMTARLAEAERLTAVLARAGETAKYQLDKLEDAAETGS